MSRPAVSSLDAGGLSEALAAFLATAPSPWTDPRPFHDWCSAQARIRLETEKDWLGSELRHLLGTERDGGIDHGDPYGPNMWLRYMRGMRAIHCDGHQSKWLAVLTVAILRDPARTALVEAMTRWAPSTPALDTLERPRPRRPRAAA
jgi:hypothetical protein